MMGCIYKITNTVNGKAYIGKTTCNIKNRIRAHLGGYSQGLIMKAIKKYGKENFTWEILHDGILDIFLNNYEKEAIKEHNTKAPNGYNITDGGEGLSGWKHTEETKQKISEARKGWNPTEETRKKCRKHRKTYLKKLAKKCRKHRKVKNSLQKQNEKYLKH